MGFLEGFKRRSRTAVTKRTSSPARPAHAGLLVTELDHGAYYTGKLGVTSVVARWHAKRRRFVLEEFALGGKRVRSVSHALDATSGERFIPIAKIEPKNEQRLSDYAFETGG
jgi:hypothetical protein